MVFPIGSALRDYFEGSHSIEGLRKQPWKLSTQMWVTRFTLKAECYVSSEDLSFRKVNYRSSKNSHFILFIFPHRKNLKDLYKPWPQPTLDFKVTEHSWQKMRWRSLKGLRVLYAPFYFSGKQYQRPLQKDLSCWSTISLVRAEEQWEVLEKWPYERTGKTLW